MLPSKLKERVYGILGFKEFSHDGYEIFFFRYITTIEHLLVGLWT